MEKKIKICGMKYPENIHDIGVLHPDMMGFVFWKGSQRYASVISSRPGLLSLPPGIDKTGIFVNETREQIISVIKRLKLDCVQLHGSESPGLCSDVRSERVKIIKSFTVSASPDFTQLEKYTGCCDYFLFDSLGLYPGGNGKSYEWSVLDRYKFPVPFFLSGGLGIHNLNEILDFRHKMLAGYDFNSRLEQAPALKSVKACRYVIQKIREYEKTTSG